VSQLREHPRLLPISLALFGFVERLRYPFGVLFVVAPRDGGLLGFQ